MKRIVLIFLLTVCLIGMAYAQTNAKERALQGTWEIVSTKIGEVKLEANTGVWIFDGNDVVCKYSSLGGYTELYTFRVVGDVIIMTSKSGNQTTRTYTLKGNTLIMRNSDFGDMEITFRRVR